MKEKEVDPPKPPSGLSPENMGQTEPLDLRTNNYKAFPFQKRMPWIYQSKPLDLRVRFVSTESEEKFKKLKNMKEINIKDNTNAIYTSEEIESSVHCDTTDATHTLSDLTVEQEGGKALVKDKVFQTIESLLVLHDPSNEMKPEYVVDSNKNVSHLLETIKLDASPIKTISTQKPNSDIRKKHVKKNEKNGLKIKRKKSTNCIFDNDAELPNGKCDDIREKSEFFEENKKQENVQRRENTVGSFFQNEGEKLSPKKMKFERDASVKQLKKSGESFLQFGKCAEVAPLLPRCRDCSLALQNSGGIKSQSDNALCRFYSFRKLRQVTNL